MTRREKVLLLLALGGVGALTYRVRQLMLATADAQAHIRFLNLRTFGAEPPSVHDIVVGRR